MSRRKRRRSFVKRHRRSSRRRRHSNPRRRRRVASAMKMGRSVRRRRRRGHRTKNFGEMSLAKDILTVGLGGALGFLLTGVPGALLAGSNKESAHWMRAGGSLLGAVLLHVLAKSMPSTFMGGMVAGGYTHVGTSLLNGAVDSSGTASDSWVRKVTGTALVSSIPTVPPTPPVVIPPPVSQPPAPPVSQPPATTAGAYPPYPGFPGYNNRSFPNTPYTPRMNGIPGGYQVQGYNYIHPALSGNVFKNPFQVNF
jgi:hypothetical protein